MMILLSALAMAASAPQRIDITPELIADLPRQEVTLTHHDESLRCDGNTLDSATGPYRLAIPGDKRGARSVRQLIALEILSID